MGGDLSCRLFFRAQMKLVQAISEQSWDFKPPRIPPDEEYELAKFQAARGNRKDIYYQVLELIGDAAMHLSVVMVLHNMYPEESADIFTVSCLNSTLFDIPTMPRLNSTCDLPSTPTRLFFSL